MKIVKCSTGEEVTSYKDYLKTKHWILKKREYAKEYESICCMCGESKYLNLHHMTYRNIGNEKLSDLCYLCRYCHNTLHDMLEDVKLSAYLRNFTQKKIKKIKTKEKCDCSKCFHRIGTSCERGFALNNKTYCKYYFKTKQYGKKKSKVSKNVRKRANANKKK